MAYFENPNADARKLVKWGNYGDVCLLCLRDKMDEEKCDSVKAHKELTGKLETEKVLKIRHSGNDIVICRDHIRKVLSEMSEGVSDLSSEMLSAVSEGEMLGATFVDNQGNDQKEINTADEEKKSNRSKKHEQK